MGMPSNIRESHTAESDDTLPQVVLKRFPHPLEIAKKPHKIILL